MRILVIEDEPRILGFLKVGLEAEGFAVDGAEDGAVGPRLGALTSRTSSSSSTCNSRISTACRCSRSSTDAGPTCRC